MLFIAASLYNELTEVTLLSIRLGPQEGEGDRTGMSVGFLSVEQDFESPQGVWKFESQI